MIELKDKYVDSQSLKQYWTFIASLANFSNSFFSRNRFQRFIQIYPYTLCIIYYCLMLAPDKDPLIQQSEFGPPDIIKTDQFLNITKRLLINLTNKKRVTKGKQQLPLDMDVDNKENQLGDLEQKEGQPIIHNEMDEDSKSVVQIVQYNYKELSKQYKSEIEEDSSVMIIEGKDYRDQYIEEESQQLAESDVIALTYGNEREGLKQTEIINQIDQEEQERRRKREIQLQKEREVEMNYQKMKEEKRKRRQRKMKRIKKMQRLKRRIKLERERQKEKEIELSKQIQKEKEQEKEKEKQREKQRQKQFQILREIQKEAQVQEERERALKQREQKYMKYKMLKMKRLKRKKKMGKTEKMIKKEQRDPRVKLYTLSLKHLILIFLKELKNLKNKSMYCFCEDMVQCSCRRKSKIEIAIEEDNDIHGQIQRLKAIIKDKECSNYFNQDRMVLLYENTRSNLKARLFEEEFVTIFDHRALALLIKKINYKKYSVAICKGDPNKKPRIFKTQKFYQEQYKTSVEEYYKKTLEIEVEFKRYIGDISKSKQKVIGLKPIKLGSTNFLRKLMSAIFQDKIKGQPQMKEEIGRLQVDVQTAYVADSLLQQMRVKNEGLQPELNYKKQNYNINFLNQVKMKNELRRFINRYEDVGGGKVITEKQKQAIEKTLYDLKKNKKQVPYPYCLFLQYRLRAQRQPYHYSNPENPSSDEEHPEQGDQLGMKRKIIKQLDMYKGYRGYKTKNRVMEKKRVNKMIVKNTIAMSKQEQFYLNSLLKQEKKKAEVEGKGDKKNKKHRKKKAANLIQKEREQMQEKDKGKEKQRKDKNGEMIDEKQSQGLPFPFNLSIFKDKSKKQKQGNGQRNQDDEERRFQQRLNEIVEQFEKEHQKQLSVVDISV